MTYSIIARDPETGLLGGAAETKLLAGAGRVLTVAPGVGAVATQAIANVAYGPDGIRLLAAGRGPEVAVGELTGVDPLKHHRQVGAVDRAGLSATFTGRDCIPWAGGRAVPNAAAQANLCAGPQVVDALIETTTATGLPFPERLVRALKEAEVAGGDRRGRQSAALVVVDSTAEDPILGRIDLRVDDHVDPITELERLLSHHRLLADRPAAGDLLPIDKSIAAELRRSLTLIGFPPGEPSRWAIPELHAAVTHGDLSTLPIGTPRPAPGWDTLAQHALESWMITENLDSRFAAVGWIDPRVVAFLRRVCDRQITKRP